MLLRSIRRIHTSIFRIYKSEEIEERIQIFRSIDLSNNLIQPLQVTNPAFLKETTAKDIINFVNSNNIANNIRILHALTHIQYNAFMSYVDTLFRFRGTLSKHVEEFEKDIRDVALEEGSHFILLSNRLKELNYAYGCMPVIPKLTYAIKQTEHSLLDRIGVISLMHEGRGVQAVEKLITQLQQIGDHKSVEVVRVIQRDEFKHFELGWKWFFKICELQSKEPSVEISHINAAYKAKIQLPKHKSTSSS